MKSSFLAIGLFATGIAGCSGEPASPGDAGDGPGASAAAGVDLGGEPAGPVYTRNQGETLALSGYDAVSYFGDDAPVKGSADFRVRFQGYDYLFANADNAARFQADPEKYVPQYGGYCAWAIGANDALAPGDPEVYKIVDGKLYLNFSKDVAQRWKKDIPGFIEKGDKNYATHDPSEHYAS